MIWFAFWAYQVGIFLFDASWDAYRADDLQEEINHMTDSIRVAFFHACIILLMLFAFDQSVLLTACHASVIPAARWVIFSTALNLIRGLPLIYTGDEINPALTDRILKRVGINPRIFTLIVLLVSILFATFLYRLDMMQNLDISIHVLFDSFSA